MDISSRQIEIQKMATLQEEVKNAMKAGDKATVDAKREEINKIRLELAPPKLKNMLVIQEEIKKAMKEGDKATVAAKREELKKLSTDKSA